MRKTVSMMEKSGAAARSADASPKEGAAAPFWEKPLEDLTRAQWEKLCDGCGRCCLIKLEDEDTGAIHHTSVACKLLDQGSCRCGDYAGRKKIVPDCVRLTLEKLVQNQMVAADLRLPAALRGQEPAVLASAPERRPR